MSNTESLPNLNLEHFSPELQTAVKAVTQAAQTIRKTNMETLHQKSEGVNNFVTAWDIIGQQIISDIIKSQFPDDPILGEESEKFVESPAEQDRLWGLDPIDGTGNAKDGRYYSFISLGFAEKGVCTLGVIYDPYHNEIFYAEKGKGAFRNGRPIHVSEQVDPGVTRISTDMGFTAQVGHLHLDMLKKHGSPTFRMMGSAVGQMREVASGITDLFFYTCLKPWDNAAAFAILKEAGARVCGIDGREIDFTSMDILAGNPTLVADFIHRVGVSFRDRVKEVQKNFLAQNPEMINIVTGIK